VSDVLDRVRAPSEEASPNTAVDVVAPLWARGAFAAAWSTAVGLAVLVVISLIVWAADTHSNVSAGGAMRFATVLWVAAHRTPLQVPDGTIAIAPLGLTLFLGLLLARASAIVARTGECDDLGGVGVVVASVTGPYAILAAIVAAIGRTGAIRPVTGAAFVTGALFAAVVSTLGALRGAGLTREAWEQVPADVRAGLRAAGRGVAVMLAGATVLAVATMLAHVSAMSRTLDAYGSGPGKFAVVALSLMLVPNAALFGASYLTGIGFAVGSGATVTLAGSHVGATPALPIFAAVPHGGAPAPVLAACVVVMLASGLAAGWPAVGSRAAVREELRTLGIGMGALALGTLVVAALMGGPAGPGRLAAVGPSPWQLALATSAEIGLVAVLVVVARAWIHRARALLAGRR
jgi:hypothetical protein